jgi:hypothetical protein
MTRAPVTRLARLESRTFSTEHRVSIRCGHLKRLPPDYTGERHIVVGRELPNHGNHEWVEFEEVPGLSRTRQTPNGIVAGARFRRASTWHSWPHIRARKG